MAAREIERVAEHPAFVAVQLPVRSAVPYGNRIWWELFETAVAHDLVVELHFGGSPGVPPTAAGWPTSWLEDYVDMASAFQSQLTSLVADGETGFLVEGREVDAFAAATAAILKDEDRARRLGNTAAQRARAYTWSIAAARLRRLYAELTLRSLVECS